VAETDQSTATRSNVCQGWRRHLSGDTSLEEIRFVLMGEPAYRVFEMVNDAAKVAAQMERMRARSDRS
jgi:hypothetical protein